MKTGRLPTLLLTVVVTLGLGACAPMTITGGAKVQNTAFGPKKRFAVVTIASTKTISAEKGITQLFKKTDDIPGANTQPLINALKPKVLKTLSHDRNITLLSERKVLHSKAYKRIQEDPRKFRVLFVSDEINVARHYKYFTNPQKMAELARELHVDGVITITMGFSIASDKSGMSVNGISFGRKAYRPTASVTAIAYDQQGKLIWKDSTVKQSEPGDTKAIFMFDFSDMTATNYQKMHPKAIEIGGKAVEVLVSRLDDTISGKGTSSVQSMR